jgi:hypothetical protein
VILVVSALPHHQPKATLERRTDDQGKVRFRTEETMEWGMPLQPHGMPAYVFLLGAGDAEHLAVARTLQPKGVPVVTKLALWPLPSGVTAPALDAEAVTEASGRTPNEPFHLRADVVPFYTKEAAAVVEGSVVAVRPMVSEEAGFALNEEDITAVVERIDKGQGLVTPGQRVTMRWRADSTGLAVGQRLRFFLQRVSDSPEWRIMGSLPAEHARP